MDLIWIVLTTIAIACFCLGVVAGLPIGAWLRRP